MNSRVVFLASSFALFLALAPAGHAVPIVGLTGGNSLVTFDSQTPGTIIQTRAITGLDSGESIQAIDLRPQDGLLYGFSNLNRIFNFTLGANAAANLVFAPMAGADNAAATAPLSTFPPQGQVSIDFNPQANALRLEDTTGDNNYRVPFATFPPTSFFNDGRLRITTPGDFGQSVGVAYTNNFPGATSTQLYAIDAMTDALFLQTSPNNGTLAQVGSGFGAGFDIPTSDVGFDISGVSTAYLSANLQPGSATELYLVDLGTGRLSLVSDIAGAPVQDIAVGAIAAIPEPSTLTLGVIGSLTSLGVWWRRKRPSAR